MDAVFVFTETKTGKCTKLKCNSRERNKRQSIRITKKYENNIRQRRHGFTSLGKL